MTDSVPIPTLSWTTAEFETKDRHPDWLWYAGLVFGIGAAIAFFYGNIFFGIFLVIAGIVTIIYALRQPKILSITLNADGITVNESLIPYSKIKQFWLDETAKPDKLLLQVQGSFVPTISLPLEGVSAEHIREHLAGKALEAEIRTSTSEKIFDRIGF